MTFNVFGAGSWGIALSSYLTSLNYKVKIFHRSLNLSDFLIDYNQHKLFPGITLSDNISFSSNLNDFNLDHINILAVPTNSLSNIMNKIAKSDSVYLILSKGIETETGFLPYMILNDKYNIDLMNIAVLSGPNHAEEVILNKPTTSVIASKNKKLALNLQDTLSSIKFRIYTSNDLIGVQILSAVKNVIAIASGISEGLKLGDNAQASLITRGMNELKQLKKIYNFNDNTLYGVASQGDLLCTCYSNFSRNKRLGVLLAKENNLSKIKREIGMTTEGVYTAKILHDIIVENKLDMPICEEVYNIIYEKVDPFKSLSSLMNRALISESKKN